MGFRVITAAMLVCAVSLAQSPPAHFFLTVVEGEGAINNIKQRTARETVVQVEDENHRPLAGVAVTFATPVQGASGTFLGNVQTLTVLSDNQGRAIARGFRPNKVQGKMEIHVNAKYAGETATATITMTNMLPAGAAAAAGGVSVKLITILAIAGAAAAAGGAIAATRGGGSSPASTTPTTTPTGGTTGIVITPGTPGVGGPH